MSSRLVDPAALSPFPGCPPAPSRPVSAPRHLLCPRETAGSRPHPGDRKHHGLRDWSGSEPGESLNAVALTSWPALVARQRMAVWGSRVQSDAQGAVVCLLCGVRPRRSLCLQRRQQHSLKLFAEISAPCAPVQRAVMKLVPHPLARLERDIEFDRGTAAFPSGVVRPRALGQGICDPANGRRVVDSHTPAPIANPHIGSGAERMPNLLGRWRAPAQA